MNSDDLPYLERVLSGDRLAFRWFVTMYKGDAMKLAFGILRDREEAEDVTQEAFIKAYTNLTRFRKESAFSTWLHRIVYNLCMDRLRGAKNRKRETLTEAEHLAAPAGDRLTEIDHHAYLTQAIQSLAKDDQVLVELHYAMGKDMNEIAGIVNQSHANVRQRMNRIRAKLKTQLEMLLGNEARELI